MGSIDAHMIKTCVSSLCLLVAYRPMDGRLPLEAEPWGSASASWFI